MSRIYGHAIWTNHVLERLSERKIPQRMALMTFENPDSTISTDRGIKFKKKFDTSTVTVTAKKNDQGEWIIISCWIDPPFPGTKDYYKKIRYYKYQRASFWGKLWMHVTRQLFGWEF